MFQIINLQNSVRATLKSTYVLNACGRKVARQEDEIPTWILPTLLVTPLFTSYFPMIKADKGKTKESRNKLAPFPPFIILSS